jgi:hypothetical protein
MFQPHLPHLTEQPLELQPHLAMPPAIDATERFLFRVATSLGVRGRGRFKQVQGAARLFAEC